MAELPPPIDADSFEAHARFVRSIARELARDSDETDEVVARTLAAAVEQRPRGGATLRGWFARVARRVVARLRRDETRRSLRERAAAQDERGDAQAADPATIAARTELIERVAVAFAALEEPCRATLYRRFYDGLTPSQIAVRESISVETVKTRLKRGLQRLRERLDAAHGGRRDDWRALAFAVATRGAAIVTATKAKVAVAAAIVALLAGAAAWQLAPRLARGTRTAGLDESDGLERARASTVSAATDAGAAVGTDEAAKRSEEVRAFASGIVVDPSGAPIADVRVVASHVFEQFDGQWVATRLDPATSIHDVLATTTADGHFRIAKAPRDLAGLYFFKPGLVVGEWFELSARPEENADHRIVLAPAARVHGRVVDTAGRPIEYAYVEVFPDQGTSTSMIAAAAEGARSFLRATPWSSQSTRTTADGRFSIDTVNEVPCRCWTSAAGYGGFPVQRELTARDTELEVVLRREAAVLVDVRDAETKEPIANARALSFDVTGEHAEELHLPFEEWLGRNWDGQRGSPQGRLVIWCERHTSGLKQPGETRKLKLVVFAERHAPAELVVVLKQGEEPPHETIELAPREPKPTLSGTVTGANDATIEIRFDPSWISRGNDVQNSPPIASLRTLTEGRFAFCDLPPATYRLSAAASGRAPVWFDVTTPRDDVAIRFAPAASLVARVVDSKGAPVPGEVVTLQSLDEQRAWSATAGSDGCARFEGLPAGTFDVVAGPRPQGERSDAPTRTTRSSDYLPDERITLVAGENGPIVVPSLERRPVTLHFEFADGSPVSNARLLRLSGNGGPVDWAYHEVEHLSKLELRTSDDGFVDVDLYPGAYQLFVVDGDVQSFAQFIVPRRGDEPIEVRLGTSRRFGTIRGRLVTISEERPIAGWKVAACVDQPDWRISASTSEVTTDADGRFVLERVPAGRVRVAARDSTDEDLDRPVTDRVTNASVRLELENGKAAEVTIHVPAAGVGASAASTTLDLEVTSADGGRPLPRVQVLVDGTIGDAEFHLLRSSLPTDEAGRLRQRFLSCARYRVRLFPPGDRGDGKTPWKPLDLEVVPVDGVIRVRAALERAESR